MGCWFKNKIFSTFIFENIRVSNKLSFYNVRAVVGISVLTQITNRKTLVNISNVN